LRSSIPNPEALGQKYDLRLVKKTGRLIVADEGQVTCGVSAEISAIIAEEAIEYLQAPLFGGVSRHSPFLSVLLWKRSISRTRTI